MSVIICEERATCRDQNVNRWYCHADRMGECPLKKCGGSGLTHPRGGDPGSADPVRCPKCGGPHPFHDPACVVHPGLIQDHENGSK